MFGHVCVDIRIQHDKTHRTKTSGLTTWFAATWPSAIRKAITIVITFTRGYKSFVSSSRSPKHSGIMRRHHRCHSTSSSPAHSADIVLKCLSTHTRRGAVTAGPMVRKRRKKTVSVKDLRALAGPSATQCHSALLTTAGVRVPRRSYMHTTPCSHKPE